MMNTQEMMRILDSIARDRNIDKQILVKDLEQAMVSAARLRAFGFGVSQQQQATHRISALSLDAFWDFS